MSGESDLAPLESVGAGLLAALEPAARRELARGMAQALRASQSRRIAAQKNPDGSDYEARKPQLRQRKGALRRSMFAKLRTSRFLKASASPDAAVVHFTPGVVRIARVHQEGLRDRVNRKGLMADYPARRLLGITGEDRVMLEDMSTEHLASRL